MVKVANGSKKEKEQFWSGQVTGWKRSGLSQREYCSKRNVPLSTFALWKKRLAELEAVEPPCVELVPLPQLRAARPVPIVVVLGNGRYRVELFEGFHAATLREVVDVLEVYR